MRTTYDMTVDFPAHELLERIWDFEGRGEHRVESTCSPKEWAIGQIEMREDNQIVRMHLVPRGEETL